MNDSTTPEPNGDTREPNSETTPANESTTTIATVKKRRWAWRPGPAILVTACFVGPGTVTTASLAGANFGFALMWAAVFSTLATIALQEMTARLGLASGRSLGEAIRETVTQPILRIVVVVLVVCALGIGSAVYAQGDMTGTALGLAEITRTAPVIWPLIMYVLVAILMFSGRIKVISAVLSVLVGIMALVFIITAIMVRPDVVGMLKGSFIPTVPDGSVLSVIGLIGTTVVGYNLFLHSSSVIESYPRGEQLRNSLSEARTDTSVSIAIGGLIALAIIATGAAAFFNSGIDVEDAAMMATQLEPLLGPAAKYFFALGLFSAGLSSVVAGGLAAAFAVSTTLGWGQDAKSWKFRSIWLLVLGYGAITATTGNNPIAAILFAQATNGVLLPILVIVLLVVMNNKRLLGTYRNGPVQNTIGAIVVLVVIGLSANSLLDLFGVLS